MYFSKKDTIQEMNKLGQDNCPFLFIIGFDTKKNIVIRLDQIDPEQIKWSFNNSSGKSKTLHYSSEIIAFEKYKKAFLGVKSELKQGNSFLCNLTASSKLNTKHTLLDFYEASSAKYKVYLKDNFTFFSPESFIKINAEGIISSFPMKGTINANTENAQATVLNDKKETFEHTTIVDLIRNDLSKICEKIWVERFRFLDKIKKESGDALVQVSSEVKGKLPDYWKNQIGSLIFELLPAGSITGAPKAKTLEIIKNNEKHLHQAGKRNFYTGISGIFDGKTLDSAVNIRFIEQLQNGNLCYKSGGGITHLSNLENEYEELRQKIYVPVF
jgi:para-aminobenzoate synthetase component I